jgi:branched-chain amino acid transport system ATP-binding protein
MLSGQLRPDGGTIRLRGRDVTGLSPRAAWRMGVGRTFQVAASFASMTARENVQVALLAHHRRVWRFWQPASGCFADAAEVLLDRAGIAALADRFAGELAYGDVKRLELAVALAHAPGLLLMDEPTAGMAPEERGALMALVRDLARADDVAVLFTEHDMDVVFGVADRVMVLARGRVIAEGPPDAVRGDIDVRTVYLGGLG